jgi:hypothetical protein
MEQYERIYRQLFIGYVEFMRVILLYNFDYVKSLHTENLRHQYKLDEERRKIALDYRIKK